MHAGTEGSLRGVGPCGHAVRIYRDEQELVGPVATHLAEGFAAGDPAIVVATAEHRRLFAEELERLGWRPRALEETGLLTTVDAEGTLAGLLEDAGPSRQRFHALIGGLLGRAEAAQPGRTVRVFGEMVDLLARRGRHGAALALEELWDELAARRRFSLLCAYRLDLFDPAAQTSFVPAVCRAHDHVVPADDPARLEHAVGRALAETLGPDEAERVRRFAADARRDEHIPAAQLALMWVSARMPALAGRILGAARTAYETPAFAPGR